MSNTDQTFFAAYGQPVTSVSSPPAPTRSRRLPAPTAATPHDGASSAAKSTDSAWYRVDAEHPDKVGTPHQSPARPERLQSLESVSVEFGTWNTSDSWQSSCMVVAAASSAAVTPEVPVARQKPPNVRAGVAAPVEAAVTNAVPEKPIQEKPIQEKAVLPSRLAQTVAAPTDELPIHPVAKWIAQWEVDEFAWPEELLELEREQAEYFRYAGEKLRDACQEGLKVLAVVGTRESEGCTTMAVCLARAAATAGARVALFDANLAHPELGTKLGLDFSHGWQEAIADSNQLAEAAVLAVESGLTLLPLSTSHSCDTLADPRISNLLREVAESFDLLILDAGMAPSSESAMFQAAGECPVNAALVVRDFRRTTESETLHTAARLKALGIDAIGIAENFTPPVSNRVAAA